MMTDLVMNKTRHCPYCPVAAGDDNFMWQHISDHLENQTKYPQFKPVPVPRTGVAVGNQVPMINRAGKQGDNLAKEKNNEDISTEKLLTDTRQIQYHKQKAEYLINGGTDFCFLPITPLIYFFLVTKVHVDSCVFVTYIFYIFMFLFQLHDKRS